MTDILGKFIFKRIKMGPLRSRNFLEAFLIKWAVKCWLNTVRTDVK